MELVVYVDIDDTLVRSVGAKRIPMQSSIEHVRALKQSGATLYCWSSGGAAYAHESAKEVGLEDCFVGYLPKPNVLIDDQSVADWRLCLEVHPAQVSRDDVDYWARIKSDRH
jgi:hypothetical protein